jgi:hypothetical protein
MLPVGDIDSVTETGEVFLSAATMVTPQFVADLLLSYECGIDYKTLLDEPSPLDPFPFASKELAARIGYTIPSSRTLNPAEEVQKAKDASLRHSTFILVPGRKFDQLGTRQGKGFGWYDRFLELAPVDWLRVGICTEAQFSTTPLIRESWDEPMDYICVVSKDPSSPAVCYETLAKSERFGS